MALLFHRESSPTQTFHDVLLQIHSREIWGRVKFGGQGGLSVAAFPGALPPGVDGIEFETDVPCDSPGTPIAVWSAAICPNVVPFVAPNGTQMCKLEVKFVRVVWNVTVKGISCFLP